MNRDARRDPNAVLRDWRAAEERLRQGAGDPAEVERLRLEYHASLGAKPADAADLARPPGAPGAPDRQLDATSRQLLSAVEDVRQLERRKRQTERGSDEFHRLAAEIQQKAQAVFTLASEERSMGVTESRLPEERADREPGDWTDPSGFAAAGAADADSFGFDAPGAGDGAPGYRVDDRPR